ncbi:MAG TPA: RNA polymerase sigma factor [Opitutaceae bacterium]|nr:RNA polymerase sigma factor [Opitutaceae bacterium]
MNASSALSENSDSELVVLARGGDRDAYGQLVARHQTLVVSLAYSACGDFARSQDIAQEAFVAAWRQLAELDDAAKFKAWLCGIARNLSLNLVRRQIRRDERLPAGTADAAREPAATTADPREQAVRQEESAIVWRALEQLPETYREPLILFYREHHSIERVAAALDLSEDTVKQRLSRGRGLLRDQVENLVERSLGSTTPGVLFTTAVLAALPITAAQLAAGTFAAAKGGAGAKASTLAIFATSLLAIPLLNIGISIFFGRQLLRSSRSPEERKFLRRLWCTQSLVTNAALLAVFALVGWDMRGGAPFFNVTAFTLLSLALICFMIAVPVATLVLNRERLPDFARNASLPVNASRWRRKMFLGPRRAVIYRSKLTLLGLPLLDIRFGHSEEQPLVRGTAVGWIALGDVAQGVVFAAGGFAVGGIAVGGIALGALSGGYFAGGLVAAGGVAFGGLANGVVVAVGHLAIGACISFGWEAASGLVAVSRHVASGGIAFAEITSYAGAHNWADLNPIVQTFRPAVVVQIFLPGVVNAIAAVLGSNACIRYPRTHANEPAASSTGDRFAVRVAFASLLCAAMAALAWSFDIAIERTKRHMTADADAAIAVACDAVSRASDDDAKAEAHYALGKELAKAQRFPAALAEFLWCFDRGAPPSSDFAATRTGALLSDLQNLSENYPPAKTALVERRDRAAASLLAAEGTRETVSDFVTLNRALGEEARSLELYDQLPASNKSRALLAGRLFHQFLENRRYANALEADPPARIFQQWLAMQASDFRREKSTTLPFVRKALRDYDVRWVADRIEALAGAGQLDDARDLLARAHAYDASPEARAAYRAALNRASHAELLGPDSVSAAPTR